MKIERIYKIGYLGYLLLLILALVFHKERSFFLDSAFYLFEIVKEGNFAIFHYRYIAVFAEFLPLTARWLHADLQLIAVLFSLSYVLVPLICYWLCGVMKKYEYGLVLLLFNIVLAADSFYFIPSELPLGVAFLLLMFAFTDYRKGKSILFTVLVNVILAFFVILSHPLIIFPVSYLLMYQFLNRKDLRKETIINFILLVIISVIKVFYFTDEYDANSSSGISKLLTSHYFDLPSHKIFFKDLLYKFYWLPILSAIVFVFLFRQKKWLSLGLFAGYMIAYLFLINISYQDGKAADFYIENFYLLFGVFIAVPLIFNVLPAVRSRTLPVTMLIVLTLSCGLRIYWYHDDYSQRLSWEREYLKTNSGRKLVVSNNVVPMDKLIMTWATPYEFWLLSTIEQSKTASIVINENVDNLGWALQYRKMFLGTWGLFEYSTLPAGYFKLTDTVSVYEMVK